MSTVDEAALMPKEGSLDALHGAVAEYNAARPKVARDMYVTVTLLLGVYLLFSVLVLYLVATQIEEDWTFVTLAALIVGGTFVWKFAVAPAKRFQQTLRDRMLPLVFGFVDEVQYVHGATPRFIAGMPGKEFVQRDRAVHGDMIAGVHEGLAFTLSETELSTGSGKSRQTTFKGVIFHFLREEEFPGLLIAARKPNAVHRFMRDLFGGSRLALVTSGNVEVDVSHEFRTDRAEAATPIVQGTLAKALDYLASVWRDDVVRLALTGRECYLLVPTRKDFFELPPVDTPIDFDRYIRPMIRDLVTLLATAQLVRKIG
ncbi:hypothetical protein KYK30_11105 [Shinella yambaruensis]|uniref:DUF3137 domain-containing protein n=1 Tax=Shinella yambaruensis TaxID=415996 RepID=A0ABQ5ZEN6_9HYPH|nr:MULTISPECIES: hypothetical protein [Shinella]MCJ8028273.1 hypothetical protein [Shinella yambaruensis]MCU7980245.1 hypothetical protein [Shinella yambaruensis]MCW5706260.1 DUF3137 domain-containing protein [Shinella sp.]GLR49239.1 hypothetical protein GCM10007923_04440 [Shinella yambaruensis]